MPVQVGYKKWLPHNLDVLKAALTQHIRGVLEPDLIRILEGIAQDMVDFVDNNFVMPDGSMDFPVDSGNMRDATGVAIYANGTLAAYMPTKVATQKQRTNIGGQNERDIDGHEYLMRTIQDSQTEFTTGIWIVLICAVPYAYHVDDSGSPLGRGQGFFQKTKDEMLQEIFSKITPSSTIPIGFNYGT
jgi:hypothetical protein